MYYFILHLFLFTVQSYKTYQVNVGEAQDAYNPACNGSYPPCNSCPCTANVIATVSQYINVNTQCCLTSPPCGTTIDGSSCLYGCGSVSRITLQPYQIKTLNWMGCDDDAGYCVSASSVPATSSLITVTIDNVGNCSFIANKVQTYIGYLQCNYQWSRSVRICGNLACAWSDSNNLITASCINPFCQNQTKALDSCNSPWIPQFDPSYYTKQTLFYKRGRSFYEL